MQKYLNTMYDAADLVEDAIDVFQQLRYGNEHEARVKLLKIVASATRMWSELDHERLTADSEGE